MTREEGHYTLKRLNHLPKRGNSNFLYFTKDENEMKYLWRWQSKGEYERITIGGNVNFQDLYTGNAVIIGGVVHIKNQEYYVWATKYIINNIFYDTPVDGYVTLSTSDPSDKRVDSFVINNDGEGNDWVSAEEGDVHPTDPLEPDLDLLTQVQVGFKLLLANEVVPPDINNIWIYNENLGTPDEFNNTIVGGNNADTSDSFNGSLSYDIPLPSIVEFTGASPVSYLSSSKLVFAFKTDSSWSFSSRLRLRLSNGASNSTYITINRFNGGDYNFNHNLAGDWQILSIDLLDFNSLPSQIDRVRIVSRNTPNLQMDWMFIQEGISTPTGDFVKEVIAGTNITVDSSNPQYPIVSASGGLPTGLEALDEGSGIGWRLIGRNPNNFGNIGLNAVDFSISNNPSSIIGSTGNGAITFGIDNVNELKHSLVLGEYFDTTITNIYSGYNIISAGTVNSVFSTRCIAYNNLYNNILVGVTNTYGTNGADLSTAVLYNSIVAGHHIDLYGGNGSGAVGIALIGGSASTFIVGQANVDLTQTTATQFTSSHSAANPRFIVGTGSWNVDSDTGTRGLGLVVMSDGLVSAPKQTITKIDTPTVPKITTGTTDGVTTPNKLIDSTNDFDTNKVISIGDIINNTTDVTTALVTAIDDANTLSLDADIMETGEDYIIYPKGFADRVLITKEYGDINYLNGIIGLQEVIDVDSHSNTVFTVGSNIVGEEKVFYNEDGIFVQGGVGDFNTEVLKDRIRFTHNLESHTTNLFGHTTAPFGGTANITFPDVSGTLALTVNGVTADASGDIITTGGGKFVDGTDPLDAVYMTGNVGINDLAPGAPLGVIKLSPIYTLGEQGLATFSDVDPSIGTGVGGIHIGYHGDGASTLAGSIRSLGTLPLYIGTSGNKDSIIVKQDGAIKLPNGSLFMTEQAAAYGDTVGDGQFWVKNDTPNTAWFTDDAGNDWQLGGVSPFEGTGSTGIFKRGRDEANYGNIGSNAVDLSYNGLVSTTSGATGSISFAVSQQATASAENSVAIGYISNSSIARGIAIGTGANASTSTDNIALGYYGTVTGLYATGIANIDGDAVGSRSVAIGQGTWADALSELVVGRWNVKSAGNPSSNDDTDTAFQVGTGISNVSRETSFTVLKGGEVIANSMTITKIDAEATGKVLVTREYLENHWKVKVSLTANQIKNIGTTPINAIAAPGVGKYIKISSIDYRFVWNSVAFDSNAIRIRVIGKDITSTTLGLINSTTDVFKSELLQTGTTLGENLGVEIFGTDSIATGDSTIDVYITYEIITL